MKLRFTRWRRCYEEQPARLSEAKVDAAVMLDFRVVARKLVAKGGDLLPGGMRLDSII